MKRILGLIFACSLFFNSVAHATSIPNTDDPKTFLGPTGRVGYTSTLNDYTAYNIAGEVGVKNYRVGGTLGWKLAQNQLFKVSGEYLWQKITYAFFSGDSNQWVNQGALGAAYQYEFTDYNYRPQFDLSAYYSHAPSKNLDSVSGSFMQNGALTPFVDNRRIAGSNGGGISPGIAIMPWQGGRLSAAINYDIVRYDTSRGYDEDAVGFGGTVGLNQTITDTLNVNVTAAFRQPFNNYAAYLSWYDPNCLGNWTLGLFGDYNVGKNTLPDTYNVGLSANYSFDQRRQIAPIYKDDNYKDYKGYKDVIYKGEVAPSDNLLAWTADPAVYMPQVLAIVDPNVSICPAGSPPVQIATIADDTGTTGDVVDISGDFSGNNLTFSIASVSAGAGTVSITPQGVLTFSGVDTGARQVVIRVSNACGSITSNTFSVGEDIS